MVMDHGVDRRRIAHPPGKQRRRKGRTMESEALFLVIQIGISDSELLVFAEATEAEGSFFIFFFKKKRSNGHGR
jgi:hypothetical protein